MIRISKELLSEVIGEKRVILDYEVSINKTEIHYGHKDIDEDGFINICKLAHKIENWIESKNINIIRIKENNLYVFYINAYIDEESNELVFEDSITSDSKINGIVSVGEFILNKESK